MDDNPRLSNDPDLRAALKAWDEASRFRDSAFGTAMRMRKTLYNLASHRAYGWAAMTCGRIAAYREQLDLSEVLLTEAFGRFFYVRDKYGEGIAVSHLAIPEIFRRNLDHALELALKPLSSGIAFSDHDADLLHNIAAQCYWAREECPPAILHLVKAYDLVKNSDAYDRRAVAIGNIGVILQELGEWDLALSASTEAWRLQLDHRSKGEEIKLSHLSNIVRANCELGNNEAALSNAELLLDYLQSATAQPSWTVFETLCEAFARNGLVEKAEYCFDKSRALSQVNLTPDSRASLQVGEATLMESRRDYDGAIALAKHVLEQPVAAVTYAPHRTAAMVLARSYAARGQKLESEKWKRFAAETGRERLLSNLLSNQLRTSLKVEQPTTPLTEREIACLSLAARGQTSADIAMKLDLKTRTINYYFNKILRKLNAMNRQEAIAKALAANLLPRP